MIIFHIADKFNFEKQKSSGEYQHPSIEKEGFIHCSRHYQIEEVANFIFKGQKNLILLAIDENKLNSPLKYEGPSWNTFPHIYGPLHLFAVIDIFPFREQENGFVLPTQALNLVIANLSQIPTGPLYKDSKHYDAMNGPQGKDIDFYVQSALKKNGSVLDLACGTGRFSIPIARQGLKVTGIDLSTTMLSLAKTKAEASNLKIQFELGDLRYFQLQQKFDFIFCGFNSSQHLHEEKEFRSFLSCVRDHLNVDGIFAFDIFNPNISMLNRKSTEKSLVTCYKSPEDQKEINVWEYPSYDAALQLSSFRFQYEKEGQILFEENFSLRNYFPLEMDVLLRNCGFDIIKKYGGYNGDEFTSSAMKQIFICKIA